MIGAGFRKRIDSIASDRKSGAFILCRKILRLFAASAISYQEIGTNLDNAIRVIGKSHSQMPSIINILNELQNLYKIYPGNGQETDFKKALKELRSHFENIPDIIAENAYDVIKGYNNFITLSNSGLVAAAFLKLHAEKKKFKLLICESTPGREALIMARQLSKKGMDITVIPDTSIACILDNTYCAVTGCDAISPTRFRNKIGSYQLASAAKVNKAKYIILGDTYKFVRDIKSIAPPEETITSMKNSFKRYLKVFEDVPLKFVDNIIIESGVYTIRNIARIIKNYPTHS